METLLYRQGDVIFLRGMLLYKSHNENEKDIRSNGHPFIILRDIYDIGENVSCLKVSSSKKGKVEGDHYIIEKFKITGRPTKKSYVDIKNIYNVTIDKNYLVQGHVKQPDMKKLLKLVNAS